MNKTLEQIARMKATLWVNTFCYYFKRLWLVGNWMPDSIYSRYGLKKDLSAITVIARLLIEFGEKPLYLYCFVGLPLQMIPNSRPEHGFFGMVHILFFLSGIIGSFGESQIFMVTREKVTCIKYLRMDSRAYIQGALAFNYVPFFLFYLPWLLLATRLLGGTLLQGVFLWMLLFSIRMMGEAFQLLVFSRTGVVLSRSVIYELAVIGAGLTGAYLPVAIGRIDIFAAILLHPVCVAACMVVGVVSLWFITVGYRGYEAKFHGSIDANFLPSGIWKFSFGTDSVFEGVALKEKDTGDIDASEEKFKSLKGYAYINALFFARHRRLLVKPVCYRVFAAALMFAGGVVFWLLDRVEAVRLSGSLTVLLPYFVYIMYCVTVADKASRAMFYNCDKDLLRYAYYRKPKTILKNFKLRLLRVSLYGLSIAGAVCLAAAGFCLVCGVGIFTVDLLLFCLTLLLLSMLFTAHHLCLYYLFQPYSESLQVKNPFYSVINIGMAVLCYLCLQIRVGGFAFTVAVLTFTILYTIGALALVYYLAPKSFRIK